MRTQPILPAFPDIEASARLITRAFTLESPDGPSRRTLILDLSETKVPTASGLGQLVSLHTRLQASGGHLVLFNVGEWAYEVFALTRLTELFDVRLARAARTEK